MFNTFYIIGREDWYQLIVKDTHYCVACGGNLDKILASLKRLVKRHKTKERLLKDLKKMDYGKGGKVSPATFEHREEEYREKGHVYEDLVQQTVEEAFIEMRGEGKKTMNKVMTRVKKSGGVSPLVIPEKEEPPEGKRPVMLGKPKLIKRK